MENEGGQKSNLIFCGKTPAISFFLNVYGDNAFFALFLFFWREP